MVTRAQLVAAGMSEAAIDHPVRAGRLRVLHRGVYAIAGVPLRDEGVWLAAVLACGPGAVLSHQPAARLWGMRVPRRDQSVHVSLVAGPANPPGITVHRTRYLTRADVVPERGIRVTTPARTVADCADTLTYEDLRALADHGVRLDLAALERARERAPGRRGAPNLAALIASDPRNRERDYEDDARLVAAGWRPVRFSHGQVLRRSDRVAARLAELLRD